MTISNIVREKKGGGVLIKEKKFLKTNFLSGVLACCFGLCMAGVTGLSRGIYPMTVFVLLILIGMVLLGSAARGAPDQPLSRIWWKEIVMILFLFINPLMAGTLGFYFSAFFVIAGISWLITPVKTGKALAGVLAYSLLVTVAAFAVFTVGLKIVTPSGILR
ncbi:hypothetical protein D4758_05680 [Enterocloster citroniae]|nr:hypothetical protein [Enterocloster citroniae]